MSAHGATSEKNTLFAQPKAVYAVAFACVVSFMGIGLVDPILPALSSQLDASPSQVTLLFTSYLVVTAVAMLVCSLGCDALFEQGYIVVGENGRMRRGRPAETKDLERAVDLLIGKVCTAHNDLTEANFKAHRTLVQPESGADARPEDSRDAEVSRN